MAGLLLCRSRNARNDNGTDGHVKLFSKTAPPRSHCHRERYSCTYERTVLLLLLLLFEFGKSVFGNILRTETPYRQTVSGVFRQRLVVASFTIGQSVHTPVSVRRAKIENG